MRLTTRTPCPANRRAAGLLASAASIFCLLLSGCSGGASGPLRVQAVITADGSFDAARIARLVLAVDGDGDARETIDVPLGGGFGNGVTAVYESRGARTLVLAAVALDSVGARVASGVADPVLLSATAVANRSIVLSSAGRVDAGTAPRDLASPDL